MSERKNAYLTTILCNVGFPITPIVGTLLILLLFGQGLVPWTRDGSLILAGIAITGGSIPVALPIGKTHLSDKRSTVVGLSVLFCAILLMIYTAIYVDIAMSEEGHRSLHYWGLGWLSVSSLAISVFLALLLTAVRPTTPTLRPGQNG